MLGCTAVAAAGISQSSSPTPSGPAHVQSASAHVSNATAIRVKLPDAVQSGDLLVAYSRWSGGEPITIGDDQSNAWSDSGSGLVQWSDDEGSQVLYASGVAAGSTTITVRFSAPVSDGALYVHEYSGVDDSDPVDVASAGSGNGERLASRTIGTTQDGDLLFGAGSTDSGAIVNSGNNYDGRSADGREIVEDRIAGDAGKYRATAWADEPDEWVMQVVAFRASGSGGSGGGSSSPSTTDSSSQTPPASETSTAPSTTPTRTSPTTPTTSQTSTTPPPSSSSTTTKPTTTSASSTPPPDDDSGCALPDFPDGSCTGVPTGTKLTAYTGPCVISEDNTVIDSKTVSCSQLGIQAKNVTITNSKLNSLWLDQDVMHARGLSGWSVNVVDTEIDAGTSGTNGGVCCGNYTLLRVNAHGGHNGAQCENGASYCRITDSWLHGQLDGGPVGSNHLGGFLHDGDTPATLTHNTIACDHIVENGEGCTGDINLIANFGPMHDVTIQSNYLVANPNSAYCTYAGGSGAGGASEYKDRSSNIVYKDNVFGRSASQPNGDTTDQCADYGPVTGFDSSGPGNVWQNNRYDTGAIVSPAN